MVTVKIKTMLEVLRAVHLSSFVKTAVEDRGGVLLIGPPGILKTALLESVDHLYKDAIALSDFNVKMFAAHLRDEFAGGAWRTMILTELSKVYERMDPTAANIEGTIRALVAEGFKYASFEDPTAASMEARCVVLAALPHKVYRERLQHWKDSGFARRFLFVQIRLANPEILDEAVNHNVRVEFENYPAPPAPNGPIEFTATPEDGGAVDLLLKEQPFPHATQKLLMMRILSVLKWWYPKIGRDPRTALRTLEEFGRTLSKTAPFVVLDGKPGPVVVTTRVFTERCKHKFVGRGDRRVCKECGEWQPLRQKRRPERRRADTGDSAQATAKRQRRTGRNGKKA